MMRLDHTLNYIETTGINSKLALAPNYHGLDADAFKARACGAVNAFTGRTWASGDWNAMRVAENLAAFLYSDENNFTVQAEQLRQRAVVLFDILNPKPCWRN